MSGQRITNDHCFKCDCLSNKTVEYFSAFYSEESGNDVLMVVLKLKEVDLYQRFFLDAALGFWEEWNSEDTFYDLDGLRCIDLLKENDLLNKKVSSIICTGSFEGFSSITFKFEQVNLLLKFSESNDFESDVVLIKL